MPISPVPTRPALALLALVLLTGCSSGTEDVAADDPVVQVPSAAASGPAPTASPGPTAPAVRVVDVRFSGGQVSGVESRVSATLGEQLLLRITSDVAEEVHVHGYDLTADVPAGGTAEIAFTADVPGGFEVELEALGKALFQLRVA